MSVGVRKGKMESGDNYLDRDAMSKLRAIKARVGEAWRAGATEVLKSRNPDLLRELDKLEAQFGSLAIIPNKPKSLKKQMDEILTGYEETAKMCVQYANRHLPAKK